MHNCLFPTICIFIENRLVTIGGIRGNSEYVLSVEVTQLEKNQNSEILLDRFPYALASHSATIIPTGILICGGYGDGDGYGYARWEKRCFEYKKTTGTWESFASMTTYRDDFDMKFLNQAVWAIGGWGSRTARTTLDKYDINTNVWTNHSIPFDVHGHCLTEIIDDRLFLIGGEQWGSGTVSKEMR